MKKSVSILFAVIMMACVGSFAYALDGYVCAKDNVASDKPGKCSVCGADLAKGEVKEVKDAEGKVKLEPAPAEVKS